MSLSFIAVQQLLPSNENIQLHFYGFEDTEFHNMRSLLWFQFNLISSEYHGNT